MPRGGARPNHEPPPLQAKVWEEWSRPMLATLRERGDAGFDPSFLKGYKTKHSLAWLEHHGLAEYRGGRWYATTVDSQDVLKATMYDGPWGTAR